MVREKSWGKRRGEKGGEGGRTRTYGGTYST